MEVPSFLLLSEFRFAIGHGFLECFTALHVRIRDLLLDGAAHLIGDDGALALTKRGML